MYQKIFPIPKVWTKFIQPMKFGPILGHFSPFLNFSVDLHEILYSKVFYGADFKNFNTFAKFTPEMAFLGQI